MCAVAVVVVGSVVVVDKVPTVDIVDITVVVIIDPIVGDLSGVNPDVGSQVRMV